MELAILAAVKFSVILGLTAYQAVEMARDPATFKR